jgi:hypothetical protein
MTKAKAAKSGPDPQASSSRLSKGAESAMNASRSDDMNMINHAFDAQAGTPAKAQKHFFLDENGNLSDRCGPDLTKATPIDDVMRELGRLRGSYSPAFIHACADSGIDVSVIRTRDGEDHLMIGFPIDSQENLRRPRYDALVAQLGKTTWRRQSVIDLANMLGRFADNQPYRTIEEAAGAYIAAGGRIMVGPDGQCDEILHWSEAMLAEGYEGYPIRRMLQRYDATLRKAGARKAMAAFVRAHGRDDGPSGWIVLEAAEQRND